MPTEPILNFGTPGREWKLAPQEEARQAIPPIRGYTYQFHRTAEAWIDLREDQFLYLEVAEDFAKIVQNHDQLDEVLQATLVKETRESGSVTLNSADVLEAIQRLFDLQERNRGRTINFTFLTTSPIGREKKSPLPSKRPALEVWQIAAEAGDVAEIREALLLRFQTGSIREFLKSSTDDQLRDRLLTALTFSCGEDDGTQLESRNREELVRRRGEVDASADMAHRAYDVIVSEVVRTILAPGTRMLDRQKFMDLFSRATNYGVPSQVHLDMVAALSRRERTTQRPPNEEELKRLAKSLLDTAMPPRIQSLFPDAGPSSLDAWRFVTRLERFISEPAASEGNNSSPKLALRALVSSDHRKHLVTAPPGSGKSFSLWQLADDLLYKSDLIPLFLPITRLKTWQQVLQIISDIDGSCTSEDVVRDPRVCVLLDGWSEFATGESLTERHTAHRMLDGARVIANARQLDPGDSSFKEWNLQQLPIDSVMQAIQMARPTGDMPAPDVLDLLRLPLMLSLFLLSESDATRPGELLRRLHDHLAKDLPQQFTDALCVAASRATLTNDSSYQRFESELRHSAAALGISESKPLLQQLGTIVNRGGHVAPLHDLYWSWLVGCGLLIDDQVATAVSHIATRESLRLALQSGQRAAPVTITHVAALDVILAAEIDASRRLPAPHVDLVAAIEKGLADQRLSVRSRSAIAGLESKRPQFIRRALSVFSETSAKLNIPEWIAALSLKELYESRNTLMDWIGSPGSYAILDFIAKNGGEEWLPWLEQLALEKKGDPNQIVATALACARAIPQWGFPHLDTLARKSPWLFRAAATKGANLELARWIALHYDEIIASGPPGGAGWLHLNKLLVACADDAVFESLLAQFCTMCTKAQEVLCFAVAELGDPWISKFQKIAFASRKKADLNPFHKLSDVFGDEVDDATARQWIDNGYDNEGWRVLIAHHGNQMVPELVAALPDSFNDLHYISALANMRHFRDPPKEIIPEIMKRVRGNMQPMATEHVLEVLATVKPQGMLVIVDWIAKHAAVMPAYHVQRSLRLYEAWRQSSSQEIFVATAEGTMPYPVWIAANSAAAKWENHFTPMVLSTQPELATEVVLNRYGGDDEKAEAILSHVKGIRSYNASLFRRMIGTPKMAALIPQVFIECLDTFPASALLQLIRSEHVNQDMLLFRLSATSNPMHRPVHAELIKRVVSQDANLHHCRYLGAMLISYSRHEALQLLMETTSPGEDCSIWLVREVETARKQRLLDEGQQWIQ